MKHARNDYDRIQDPSGYIPEDEPVFLLRAQDKNMVPTLVRYADLLEADPDNHDPLMAESVRAHIREVQRWQADFGSHTPDMPEGAFIPAPEMEVDEEAEDGDEE